MRVFHWRFLGQDSFKILCQSQVDVGPSRKCRLVEVFAKSDLALHLDQRLLKEEDVSLEQGAALGLDSFNPSHPRHNSFARDSLQNGAILKEDTQATTGRGSVARVNPFWNQWDWKPTQTWHRIADLSQCENLATLPLRLVSWLSSLKASQLCQPEQAQNRKLCDSFSILGNRLWWRLEPWVVLLWNEFDFEKLINSYWIIDSKKKYIYI